MGMTTEERMKWTGAVIRALWYYAHDKDTHQNLIAVSKVLEHGMQKHGSKPHRGAVVDLEHAMAHLEYEDSTIDPDTKQPHFCHAAADCLLAFGDLIGINK